MVFRENFPTGKLTMTRVVSPSIATPTHQINWAYNLAVIPQPLGLPQNSAEGSMC